MSARRIELPFQVSTSCLLVPPAQPRPGQRPPLLVALHGQGQDGARQRRWMGAALPPHWAGAFPDGLHKHEVRRPERPIRIGCSWYLFDGDRTALVAELARSAEQVWRIVDAALAELDADPARLWLAGFSQGAYLANYLALSAPGRVAGWIAQAGGFRAEYLGGDGRLPELGGRPVLLQHGRDDRALPPERSEALRELLAGAGADVSLRTYAAGHVITPAMASDAREWLSEHGG